MKITAFLGNLTRGKTLLNMFNRLAPLPGGRRLFSKTVAMVVPYSGSIGAVVEDIKPGSAVLTMRNRRSVRNHLGSVHAIALANLAEMASGLAFLTAAPDATKSIVTRLDIEYLHKAKGERMRAEASVSEVVVPRPEVYVVPCVIYNDSGVAVAKVSVHWKVSTI